MVSFYYNRFATFRKVLDAEMKDATKCGIAQKCQMDSREEITEDEEGILWEKGLLGRHSAESLFIFITANFSVFELANIGYLGPATFV